MFQNCIRTLSELSCFPVLHSQFQAIFILVPLVTKQQIVTEWARIEIHLQTYINSITY